MKPEVRPKFVAFLEVGTELNLVGKKNAHCDKMRLNKVYVTLRKKTAPVPMAVRGLNGAKNKKIARCHLVNNVYVAFLKKK